MSVISSNMSALAHASFPSQRMEAPLPEREIKPSTEMPPVAEPSSSAQTTDARSDTFSENQSHNSSASAAEATVQAAANREESTNHPITAKEDQYRSITNINAVDENGKYLDLKIPLVDELPDRPIPKV